MLAKEGMEAPPLLGMPVVMGATGAVNYLMSS